MQKNNKLKPLYRNIYGTNEVNNIAREERVAAAKKKRALGIWIVAIFTIEIMVGIGVIAYFMYKG